MSLKVRRIRLNEDAAVVDEKLTNACPADSIVAVTSHNEKVDNVTQPVLVVVFRA